MFTIAMDMDGVLYPFDLAFNELSLKHGGPEHDFKNWINFSEVFGDEVVDKIWGDPTLFNCQPPYMSATLGMAELRDMPGVEVFVVTNPGRNPEITIPAKWAWLQHNFPWIDAYHFVTMHAKWLFKTDMIVEDFPGNINKWVKHNPGSTAVMIERPWNQTEVPKLLRKNVYVLSRGVETVPALVSHFIHKEAVNE
jgi:5'(3')-deoxyribonucleotidase